jgi:hypothetical protein
MGTENSKEFRGSCIRYQKTCNVFCFTDTCKHSDANHLSPGGYVVRITGTTEQTVSVPATIISCRAKQLKIIPTIESIGIISGIVFTGTCSAQINKTE